MNLKKLRDILARARYQFSVATNMGCELSMVNKDDPFLSWRIDWFLAWRKGNHIPKARPRFLMEHPTKKDFDSIFKQLSEDDGLVKFAECSNFASHAMSMLLREPEVTVRYNVCLASTGFYLNHTIVILLPKNVVGASEGWKKSDLITNGALIIDPWAMAMGYGVEDALAVNPDAYIYADLLDKVTFPYQSINDPLFTANASLRDSIRKISTARKLDLECQLPMHNHYNKYAADKISSIREIPSERKLTLSFSLFPHAHRIKPSSEQPSLRTTNPR